MIQVDSGSIMLPLHSITHIEADGNYTYVHQQGGESIYTRRGIQQWAELLPPERFVRVHRSLIVNRLLVKKVHSQTRELGELLLEGAALPVALTRRALQRIRRFL